MVRGLVAVAVLAGVVSSTACGATNDAPSDAGAADAGARDAAVDAAVDAALFEPAPAALPVFTPCPPGWREVPPDGPGEPATCEPWPASGRVAACPIGQAHFPGEPSCRAVGDPCPIGEWPEGLPATGSVLYVRAGATGGDGTQSLPFGTITEAIAVASPGGVIAIAKGRYAETARVNGALTLWGACAAETSIELPDMPVAFAIIVRGGAGQVDIRNLRLMGLAGTLLVFDGDVSVHGLVSEGARTSGVVVYDGAVDIEDLLVRTPAFSGVSMQSRGRAMVRRAVIEGSMQQALHAIGATLDAADIAIERPATSPDVDEVIRAWGGGSIRLERAVIEDADSAEVAAAESGSVELRDVIVRRNEASTRTTFDGATVLGASTMTLTRVRIEWPRGSGVFVGEMGSTASLTDVMIRDVRTAPEPPLGRGVSVEVGARLTAERVLVERAVEIGVFVGGDDTIADLTDVTIRDTRSTSDGLMGRGLQVQLGARVTGARVRIEAAREVGIVSAGTGASVMLGDVTIGPILERGCAPSSCAGLGGGIGAGVYLGGALVLDRFSVASSALAGLQVARDGQLDLHVGVVRDNPVGANVQTLGYDFARLSDRVAFVNNGVGLASEELPVPDLGL